MPRRGNYDRRKVRAVPAFTLSSYTPFLPLRLTSSFTRNNAFSESKTRVEKIKSISVYQFEPFIPSIMLDSILPVRRSRPATAVEAEENQHLDPNCSMLWGFTTNSFPDSWIPAQ